MSGNIEHSTFNAQHRMTEKEQVQPRMDTDEHRCEWLSHDNGQCSEAATHIQPMLDDKWQFEEWFLCDQHYAEMQRIVSPLLNVD